MGAHMCVEDVPRYMLETCACAYSSSLTHIPPSLIHTHALTISFIHYQQVLSCFKSRGHVVTIAYSEVSGALFTLEEVAPYVAVVDGPLTICLLSNIC